MDRLTLQCTFVERRMNTKQTMPAFFFSRRDKRRKGNRDMKHRKERFVYVGIDLHKRTHTAVVINCWNEKQQVIGFENKPAAFPAMVEQVMKYVDETQTVVFGLEDVGGSGGHWRPTFQRTIIW